MKTLLSIHLSALKELESRILMTPVAVIVEAARRTEIETGPYAGLPVAVNAGVAVVDVSGVLYKGAPAWMRSYGINATERITRGVQTAANDPDVDSILLRIDSGGGSVDGLSELGDTIYSARQRKNVVASIDGMAASAAYYAASQASRIASERTAMVGSIGVRMILYDFSKLFDREGIKAVVVDTGTFKSAGAMGTEITEEQIDDFQRIVDQYFGDFVSAVARGRQVNPDMVRNEWGDGRVWLAPEAAAMRLIDSIATVDQTIGELRERAAASVRYRTAAAKMRTMVL